MTNRAHLIITAAVVVNLTFGIYCVNFFMKHQHEPGSISELTADCSDLHRKLEELTEQVQAGLRNVHDVRSNIKIAFDSIGTSSQLPATVVVPSTPILPATASPATATPASASPATANPPSSASTRSSRWLTIGLPSVPRRDGVDYLNPTLDALVAQLPSHPEDPFYQQVAVVVVNNRPGEHAAFDAARTRFKNHPKAAYFLFVDDKHHDNDDSATDEGSTNIPGARVRRQTRDVVWMMEQSIRKTSSRYFLFMEDDFSACPHLFRILQYLAVKADAAQPWIAMRVSYGLNGVLMHSADVSALAAYLHKHQRRRPPDHLVVEWLAHETDESRAYVGDRVLMAYRWNVLDHMGTVSSLRSRLSGSYPRCFHFLGQPVNFEVESFDPSKCDHTDIWPCDKLPEEHRAMIKWDPNSKMRDKEP